MSNKYRRCQHCAYFCETVGYCSLHDKDVTRYNGCYDHIIDGNKKVKGE